MHPSDLGEQGRPCSVGQGLGGENHCNALIVIESRLQLGKPTRTAALAAHPKCAAIPVLQLLLQPTQDRPVTIDGKNQGKTHKAAPNGLLVVRPGKEPYSVVHSSVGKSAFE